MRRTLLAFAATALLLVGGCAGEKSGEGVATAGDTTTSATTETGTTDEGDIAAQTAKFAQCMRDNGVEMPDPEVHGDGRVTFGMPEGGAADRDKTQAAHEKCKEHLPNGGQPPKLSDDDLEQMRKFSQCIRENGFPDFPDPEPEGGIRIDGGQNMDPESQQFKDAHAKCEQHMPKRGPRTQGGGR